MARDYLAANSEFMGVASAPVTAEPATMALWVRSTSVAAQEVISLASNATGGWWSLVLNNTNTGSIELQDNSNISGFDQIVGQVRYVAGTWCHLAGVFATSSSRTLYYNGQAVASDTGSFLPDTWTRIAVGCLWDATAGPRVFTTGQLAHPGVWNVALSTNEIGALAQGADPITIRRQSLAALWDDFGLDRVGTRHMTTLLGRPYDTRRVCPEWGPETRRGLGLGGPRVLRAG